MALATLSVALSVLVLKVHHMSPSYEMPAWVRRVVLGHMSAVMCTNVKTTDDIWIVSGHQGSTTRVTARILCLKSSISALHHGKRDANKG